jgi:hypothetical protein
VRVVHLGNFRPAHSTEHDYRRALEGLGHRVVPLQQDEVSRTAILAAAEGADLVLYTRTHGWPCAARTETWRTIERRGTRTASVHLDLFYGLGQPGRFDPDDPLFTTGTVFTPDGDHDDWWASHGINHRYLRAGVDRASCYLADVPMRDDGVDVIFVGTDRGYHPEWPHRRQLLSHLRDAYGERFRKYGGREGPTVRGRALNELYASTPVVVGDTLSFERERATFWSDRVYETLGRGGFLIHPAILPLAREVGYIAYEFGNWDDLDHCIDSCLAHRLETNRDNRATMIGWVRDYCTYTHRAAELLHALDLAPSPAEQLEPLGLAPPIPTVKEPA